MKKLLAFVLFVCLGLSAFSQDDRSTGLWNKISLIIGLNSRSDLCISTKTQYIVSENTRELTNLDCSVSRTMNSWLKLGAAFRAAQMPKETGDVYEYRPQFLTTIFDNKHLFKYKTTNRLEYRDFTKGNDYFRYYNNVFIDFPVLPVKFPCPYLGEELFIKLNGEGLHLARIYGGLHVYEQSHFTVDVYYVWQKTKTERSWSGSDIFGLNLTFKI